MSDQLVVLVSASITWRRRAEMCAKSPVALSGFELRAARPVNFRALWVGVVSWALVNVAPEKGAGFRHQILAPKRVRALFGNWYAVR